jgi:hypothetical protein
MQMAIDQITRYHPRMRRFLLTAVLSAAVLLVAAPVAPAQPRDTVQGPIALRLKVHEGPWKRSLSIKLHRLVLTSFSICGIWNRAAGEAFSCDDALARTLPSGTILRLEQNPAPKAAGAKKAGKGWGTIGLSTSPSVGAVISNVVTGDQQGVYRYRATLRDRSSNRILGTSNAITFRWR